MLSSKTEVIFISWIPMGMTESKSKGKLSWDADGKSWPGSRSGHSTESGRRDGELHVETLMLALGLVPVVVSEALQ